MSCVAHGLTVDGVEEEKVLKIALEGLHERNYQQSDHNDAACECGYYGALAARGSSVAGDVL